MLDVKQPKILMFDVIEGKILVFSVFEIPPSRPSYIWIEICQIFGRFKQKKNFNLISCAEISKPYLNDKYFLISILNSQRDKY